MRRSTELVLPISGGLYASGADDAPASSGGRARSISATMRRTQIGTVGVELEDAIQRTSSGNLKDGAAWVPCPYPSTTRVIGSLIQDNRIYALAQLGVLSFGCSWIYSGVSTYVQYKDGTISSPLNAIYGVFAGSGEILASYFVVRGLAYAAQPLEGELHHLYNVSTELELMTPSTFSVSIGSSDAEEEVVKVKRSSAKALRNWERFFATPAATVAASGGAFFAVAFVYNIFTLNAREAWFCFFNALFAGIAVPAIASNLMAMKTAAVLASDAVNRARDVILTAKFADDDDNADTNDVRGSESPWTWEEHCVPMVKKLVEHTLPQLSSGWGVPVLMTFVGSWTCAAGLFAKAVRGNPFQMILVALTLTLPFIVASDVANVSTDCDRLQMALHWRRLKVTQVSVLQKIEQIEILLDRCNKNQGLGFVAGATVIDKVILKTIFAKLFTGLSLAVPLVLSYAQRAGINVCALTAQQTASIQAIMLNANATCSFNMSLDTILGK